MWTIPLPPPVSKPRIFDRVRDTPMTHAVALITFLGGVDLSLTDPALTVVHPAIAVTMAVMGILAPLLVLAGIHWRGEDLTGWTIEKVGLLFVGSVWGLNAAGLILCEQVGSLIVSVIFASAALMRGYMVHARSRIHAGAVRHAVEQAAKERDEG